MRPRGPSGERGPRPGRGARLPARPSAPLTREATAPLAVPAAPLQDEVAAALLSHPQLQGVLQQHLLGLEPHLSGPATHAGFGSHRRRHRPRRAELAREEAMAGSERPALGTSREHDGCSSWSAAGSQAPPTAPSGARPCSAHRPAHGRPGLLRQLPQCLPGFRGPAAPARSSGVERGSPIPAPRFPSALHSRGIPRPLSLLRPSWEATRLAPYSEPRESEGKNLVFS